MSNTPDGICEAAPEGVPTELYATFTQSVRELADATLRTNADADALARAESEIRAITARLAADQIPGTHGESCTVGGMVGSWGNSVVGLRNAIAMPLEFQFTEDSVWAEFTAGALYEGPPGHMHGGVIALLLDQVLGELASHLGQAGLTANLSVDYKVPTRLNTPLRVEARLDRAEGHKTWAKGSISAADGTVCAVGTGLFVLPSWLRGLSPDERERVRREMMAKI